MRQKIYRMVHIYTGHISSEVYKYLMMALIALSLLPLMFKEKPDIFTHAERICLCLFTIDYVLRWITADYKFGKMHWSSFIRYPFRLISILDMLSIFALLTSSTNYFSSFSLAESLTVFRIVRLFRYSKGVRTILSIFRNSRKPLTAVGSLALGYIFLSAIVIFKVEPDSFQTFFDAVYWSTVSLTTVGYGDIYPVTVLGRLVAMFSSFFGIAIVALPAGILTAEYMRTLNDNP